MKSLDQIFGSDTRKRLLVIFPHPDDEVFMAGGAILRAIRLGYMVRVVSLTKGERGKNHSNKDGSLAEIREREFVGAMQVLGVDDYHLGSSVDGGLWESDEWQEQVKKEIEGYEPSVVISYGPTGVTGHPDHIALGKWVYGYLAEHSPETLLLWPVWPGKLRSFMVHEEFRSRSVEIDFVLTLGRSEHLDKRKAMWVYVSQLGNLSFLQRMVLGFGLIGAEYFQKADYRRQYQFKKVKFSI